MRLIIQPDYQSVSKWAALKNRLSWVALPVHHRLACTRS